MRRKFSKENGGFTVIELLVAVGVFVVVIGIAVGIFLNSLRSQRLIIDTMAMNDSASLALEQITRELRTGSGYSIPGPPVANAGTNIKFKNSNGTDVIYEWNSAKETIERSADDGATFYDITSSNVRVTALNFVLVPQYFEFSSVWPQRITVFVEVGSKKPNLSGIVTHLQATVSARDI